MPALTVPAWVRALDVLDDLEYSDTSHVMGLRVDLNRDGHPDYIIQSAESLCGTGGCEYAIVDGAMRRIVGTVFGSSVYVDASPRGRFPTLHSLASMGYDSAEWTEYLFRDGSYIDGKKRELSGTAIDSLNRSLRRFPLRMPPN